jgi:hypothetical protein
VDGRSLETSLQWCWAFSLVDFMLHQLKIDDDYRSLPEMFDQLLGHNHHKNLSILIRYDDRRQ